MKKRKLVKHHIINRINGGKSTKRNLLLIEEKKERAFHILFNHKTLEEAGNLLIRLARMKNRQRE